MDERQKKIDQLWFDKFKYQEKVYDYADNLIIKDQFNTAKKYSWGVDYFDIEDKDQVYIASQEFITKRAGRKKFEVNGLNFELIEDLNTNFRFVSANKIINYFDPFNVDLYFQNLLESKEQKEEFLFFALSIKKMKDEPQQIFNNFLYQYLKDECFVNFSIEELGEQYILKFIFKNNKNQSIVKYFDLAIFLTSIIPLFVYRLRKKFKDLWLINEFVKKGKYFNFILFELNKEKDPAIVENIQASNLTYAFENTIYLNEKFKQSITSQNNNYTPEHFSVSKDIENKGVYVFNYLDSNVTKYISKKIKE
ncbi:unknown; predicted coding region [Mycoplasmopsis pulmonis]|uniref:Uncharacterized protein n=1 Tax=Mycoplasmopsis pulmonis (strain UAB CTIP) TaxID=272635 RepID=Q98QR2_MYCPU|nr:hypothetical protein [Mycoplasmopsis pulmonis]CAC13472.1 unknown; predicted coding region [Mycoplasmopsis pulmonis]VEU68062.1 Uncharacterised protein [Mycoplasmopsis pulmonis]